MSRNKLMGAVAIMLAMGLGLQGQSSLPTLQKVLPVGGTGGWDYVAVEPSTHRLWVSHATQMHVVDPASKAILSTLSDTPGVHGVAFVESLNRAFITCGGDTSVRVVDAKTFKQIASIKSTGKKPDAIVYDSKSKLVFVMNNGGDSIMALDPSSLKVVGTIALAGAPEFAQVDGHGRLYVNLEDKAAIAVIDTATLKVVKEWPLSPAATPTGLAIDVEHHRLFSGCRSKHLVVVDTETGQAVSSLPIGEGVDACAYDPELKRVYASCKDGTVAVIESKDAKTYASVGTLRTERGSKTLALDASSHQIYVPAGGAAGTPGDAKAGFQILVFGL